MILDNFVYGYWDIVENVLKVEMIFGDISDCFLLDKIFIIYNIVAVMYFAVYIFVGELVKDFCKYYYNNVVGILILLEVMFKVFIKKFVFFLIVVIYGEL